MITKRRHRQLNRCTTAPLQLVAYHREHFSSVHFTVENAESRKNATKKQQQPEEHQNHRTQTLNQRAKCVTQSSIHLSDAQAQKKAYKLYNYINANIFDCTILRKMCDAVARSI